MTPVPRCTIHLDILRRPAADEPGALVFYAVAFGQRIGQSVIVHCYRGPDGEPDFGDEALPALDALVVQLSRQGWKLVEGEPPKGAMAELRRTSEL